MTLAEKSAVFVRRVQDRHLRWGLTADSQLDVPGDRPPTAPRSTDNDGLWTMYVAAEAFRFKVTGAADARANATRGMQAIVRLDEITGIRAFPRVRSSSPASTPSRRRRMARHARQAVAVER